MTLKVKIIFGYLLIIVVCIFVSALTINDYTKVTRLYEETMGKYSRVTRVVDELTYRMLQRQSGLQGFLMTGKTRYLISYDENALPMKALMKEATELNPTDKDYASMIGRYEKLVREWEEGVAEKEKEMRHRLDYGLIGYRQFMASIAEIDSGGRSILRELKVVENQLARFMEQDMLAKSQLANRVGKSTRRLLITIALASILGSLGFGIALSNHIVSGLKGVVRAARIISTGDFSHRVPRKNRNDELGFLADSFNQMAKKLEENICELKESEEKYSTLVENASDGIGIIQDERYVFANRAFMRIMGYSAEEVQGMHYLAIAAPESADHLRERHVRRLAGEDVPGITEAKFIAKNGEIRYSEVNTGMIEYRNQRAALVIFRDITERKEHETSLKKLSEQVFRAQEEERKRISRELHDEIGQVLAALNISTELLQKDDGLAGENHQKKLEDMKKLIEKGIDEVHRISYNLRPYVLDNFGLVSALRWYVKTFARVNGIEASLQIEGEWEKLEPAVETMIYRVIQEALTNVSKHAQAGRAFVCLSRDLEGIRITIEDNGIGFEVEGDGKRGALVRGGLGLFGIGERVSTLGGDFSISSKPGSGTRLLIEIPSGPAIGGEGSRT
ncbi:MAG: PAS domain S-box protein [Syntrophorhabdales bacterium]|jgi:PAS domain S-box-containing protein